MSGFIIVFTTYSDNNVLFSEFNASLRNKQQKYLFSCDSLSVIICSNNTTHTTVKKKQNIRKLIVWEIAETNGTQEHHTKP